MHSNIHRVYYQPFSDNAVEVTPVLRILVAIGCGLALVAVSLIIVLKVRPTFVRRKRREAGDGMSVHNNRATSFAPGTHIPLSQRDLDDEMEEKDPDVIPANKGKLRSHLGGVEAGFQRSNLG